MSNLGQKLCDLGLYVRLCVDMNVTKNNALQPLSPSSQQTNRRLWARLGGLGAMKKVAKIRYRIFWSKLSYFFG